MAEKNLITDTEEKLSSLRFLSKLWEKSEHDEDDHIQFLKAHLSITEDILNHILPVYAELIDKDKLTDKEAWMLKFIQGTFHSLLFTLTHVMHIQFYMSLAELKIVPQKLAERALKLHNLLAELSGVYSEDKELNAQINKSLKDIKEGRLKPAEEVFRELGI